MTTKQDLELQFEAFTSLKDHPGWVLYNQQIKGLTAHALSQMEQAKNNEELAKHTYAYLLLLKVQTVPEGMVKALGMQLAAHTKK